ncbi:MAG: hypothetical protein CVT92_07060 [Bacteroidetes bacterium HGW-Bacteroidetes-1]|jgi:four helix bundle protein|nr:MAG: hypothetical protein CVT92_07060 [Bacteroidetes bacterium HGW-Bacteroidetes-1]
MNEPSNKQSTFFRFEDLRIYHKALEYSIWVNNTARDFAPECDGDLTKGFCNSARQISLQIAEGSAREKSFFISHLREAKSAIRSCVVYSTFANKLGYLSDFDDEESRNQLMEMTKMLGALITSLQKNLSGNQEQYEEEYYPAKNW